ncbi:MAG: hypothetical protein QM817_09280 [Archangium sp.]
MKVDRVMALLFFTSGATSLVFETLWLRGFAIVLGGTVYSMSCVLTAFMGGLALGASLASRFVARRRETLGRAGFIRAYGWLELAVGIYGLLVTLALFFGQATWLALVGRFSSGSGAVTLIAHFLFSVVVLAFPTMCMGATLPVLVLGLEDERETVTLYGLNTFGAATGALLASFVLIYALGVVGSTVVVTLINVVLALIAFRLSAREKGAAPAPPTPVREGEAWSGRLLAVLSFFSGLTFFAFELVWNRTLSLILGNRVYVMSLTLAIVLVCLGLGARVSRWLIERTGSPARALQVAYLFAAGSLCLGLLGEPVLQVERSPMLLLFVAASIVAPAIGMGVAFPLLLSLRPREVGPLYAANTVGSMVGSLLTGYVLFGTLGSNRIVLVGVIILIASSFLLRTPGTAASTKRPPVLAVAALVVVVLTAFAFRWNARLSVVPRVEGQVIDEDAYGIFSITPTDDGLLSVRCNATELVYLFGAKATQYVQESQSHFPLLFAPKHDDVLVIGSGYGITAGAAAQWPAVKHVDAVEILPLMVSNADRFESGNHGYHHDPKVSVRVADGRHFLAASGKQYDVISINVSDPYLPGSASLFSSEFYELVTASLAPNGVVCQHLFGPDLVSLFHGFKRHFKYVAMVPSYENGVSVLGSQSPLEPRHFEALDDAKLGPVLSAVGLGSRDDLTHRLALGAQMQRALEAQQPVFINSDLNPALEFRRSSDVSLLMSNF